jgi:hypothetical protein
MIPTQKSVLITFALILHKTCAVKGKKTGMCSGTGAARQYSGYRSIPDVKKTKVNTNLNTVTSDHIHSQGKFMKTFDGGPRREHRGDKWIGLKEKNSLRTRRCGGWLTTPSYRAHYCAVYGLQDKAASYNEPRDL